MWSRGCDASGDPDQPVARRTSVPLDVTGPARWLSRLRTDARPGAGARPFVVW